MWSHTPSSHPHENERRQWLSDAHEEEAHRRFPMTISSHALLVLVDIEYAFRAGAWLSVIVLSQACIEATLRQVAEKGHTSPAVDFMGEDANLIGLRTLRNEILHSKEVGSESKLWKLAPNDIPACQAALEPEAKRAIKLAFHVIYEHTNQAQATAPHSPSNPT